MTNLADDFEIKVHRQIQRLKALSHPAMERDVANKRIEWFKNNHPGAGREHRPTPRAAYELLFFDYMGLGQDDLPIVAQTDTEIVWLSRNPCPTLEACRTLGLDTRRICREVYEKSTQALLSCLDPQLRFLRSYEEIRPHWDHCREWIVRVDFETIMAAAIGEARASRAEGKRGFGAVVALGRRLIGTGHDLGGTEKDPGRHAEAIAIRQAIESLGGPDLSGAILFSPYEPCESCVSLAAQANLTTIVYGLPNAEAAREDQMGPVENLSETASRLPVLMEVIGGVSREACLVLEA